MPQVTIVALALLGVIGLIVGGFATQRNWTSLSRGSQHQFWLAVGIGAVLGIASWPLTYFMGYPIHADEESGRIVGIPFMVAYFDAQGRDYVGPITFFGAVGNVAFWFLLPQLLLRLAKRGRHKSSLA